MTAPALFPSRVALTGFMACGKSSVGRLLAPMLGYPFVDLDERVVREAGMTVPAIFAAEGEAGFRARERACLAACARDTGIVLSCGGGIVIAPENRSILRESFHVVWIRVSAEEAVRRASFSAGTRPLLDHADPLGRARELLAAREELYRACADFIVDTEASRSVQSIAESIHEHLCTGL